MQSWFSIIYVLSLQSKKVGVFDLPRLKKSSASRPLEKRKKFEWSGFRAAITKQNFRNEQTDKESMARDNACCLCMLFIGCQTYCLSLFYFEEIYEKINCSCTDDWNDGHPFKDRNNISLFVSYAKNRRCGFKAGRSTFYDSLTWVSFLLTVIVSLLLPIIQHGLLP